MSHDPTDDQSVPMYQADAPMVDQELARQILTSAMSGPEKLAALRVMHDVDTFASADPAVWAEAEAAVAALDALRQDHEQGAIDHPTFQDRTETILRDCPEETVLAVMVLIRARVMALYHVLVREHARKMYPRSHEE